MSDVMSGSVCLAPSRNLSLREILLPRDTNHLGDIFGGTILAYIDLAGAVEARNHTRHQVVTRFFDKVEFKEPVKVGEVVSFWTSVVRKGNTSITVRVEVEQGHPAGAQVSCVTAASIVYVAVATGADGKKCKVALDS